MLLIIDTEFTESANCVQVWLKGLTTVHRCVYSCRCPRIPTLNCLVMSREGHHTGRQLVMFTGHSIWEFRNLSHTHITRTHTHCITSYESDTSDDQTDIFLLYCCCVLCEILILDNQMRLSVMLITLSQVVSVIKRPPSFICHPHICLQI